MSLACLLTCRPSRRRTRWSGPGPSSRPCLFLPSRWRAPYSRGLLTAWNSQFQRFARHDRQCARLLGYFCRGHSSGSLFAAGGCRLRRRNLHCTACEQRQHHHDCQGYDTYSFHRSPPERNVGISAPHCDQQEDATFAQDRVLGSTTLIDKRFSEKTANYRLQWGAMALCARFANSNENGCVGLAPRNSPLAPFSKHPMPVGAGCRPRR